MTERKNQCFTCGSESHYARDCPDSITRFMQKKKPLLALIPATTAARLVTSPENARSLRGRDKSEGLRGVTEMSDLREGSVLRGGKRGERRGESAAKESKGTDPKEMRRTEDSTGPEEKRASSATTARNTDISPETARTVSLDLCREEN